MSIGPSTNTYYTGRKRIYVLIFTALIALAPKSIPCSSSLDNHIPQVLGKWRFLTLLFFLTTILATKWDNSEQPMLTEAYRSGWKVFWDNSAPVCYQGTSRVKTVEQTSSSPQPVSQDVLLKHSLASVVTRKVSSICFISVLTEPQQIQGWKQLRSGKEAKRKEEWYVT